LRSSIRASARIASPFKVRRPPPPDVEWWDEGYLPEKSYDSYSTEFLDQSQLVLQLGLSPDPPHLLHLLLRQEQRLQFDLVLVLYVAAVRFLARIRGWSLTFSPQPTVKISNMMRVFRCP
jgi:hypothetical protein